VLGHEGSGTITETGSGVADLQVGDHVVLSWVALRDLRPVPPRPPGALRSRLARGGVLNKGTSRLSIGDGPAYHYLGVSAFAEEAVVPAAGAIKVRDDAPLDVISLVGCAVATGVGAVRNTAGVEAGSNVVVVGCGGVGLSVVQGARLAGAERILAIDLRPEKTALARQLGATDEIDATSVEAVEAVRDLLPEGPTTPSTRLAARCSPSSASRCSAWVGQR
jgi:S-(hydroxymethyl)glutathione dehydrogenase/alcohol dehydrogenase